MDSMIWICISKIYPSVMVWLLRLAHDVDVALIEKKILRFGAKDLLSRPKLNLLFACQNENVSFKGYGNESLLLINNK